MTIALGIVLAWAVVFTAIGMALGGGSTGALLGGLATWIVAAVVIVGVTKAVRARRRRPLG